MSRVEYMRKLASLLQDIPVDERVAAMQYYNDYFDDAGVENEAQVIEELGDPTIVAAELKAGMGKKAEAAGEFRETGYTNPQTDHRDMPRPAGMPNRNSTWDADGRTARTSRRVEIPKPAPETRRKLLWIILAICLLPVILPVVGGIMAAIAGVVVAIVAVAGAAVVTAAACVFAGCVIFIRGCILIASNLPLGMFVMGAGILAFVLGVVFVVLAVKLAKIIIPWIIDLIRRLVKKVFSRRRAVA